MNFELITTEHLASLPGDPELAFVQFESICRDRLKFFIANMDKNEDENDAYLEYMTRVAAAAETYNVGVDDLFYPDEGGHVYNQYKRFVTRVYKIITPLQIKFFSKINDLSVAISNSEKSKIEHHLESLRKRIEGSDIDDRKKRVLHKKLDEFLSELRGDRLNFARAMILIASAVAAVNQAEAAIIKLPETVAAITEVIGWAREAESEELPKIAAAPKAITGPGVAEKFKFEKDDFEIDDEIPF